MNDVKELILSRRNVCGIGLCGSCDAIAKWLYNEHGIIASTSWIAEVIKEA